MAEEEGTEGSERGQRVGRGWGGGERKEDEEREWRDEYENETPIEIGRNPLAEKHGYL